MEMRFDLGEPVPDSSVRPGTGALEQSTPHNHGAQRLRSIYSGYTGKACPGVEVTLAEALVVRDHGIPSER
jgi:hypothetical protein